MPFPEPAALLLIVVALALGGLLKGATGAGAPVFAVPVIAAFFDVRLAVVILAVPNLLSNLWQTWHFRAHLPVRLAVVFAVGGGVGTVFGTVLLANLPGDALSLMVAGSVFLYIALRLARPDLLLSFAVALRLSGPIGVAAGVLQGAAGISAPISLSFVNAMRLERATFIAVVSVFFFTISVVQIVSLWAYGLITPQLLGAGVLALAPLVAAMPLGAWLARSISPRSFDRIVLVVLALLAVELIRGAVM